MQPSPARYARDLSPQRGMTAFVAFDLQPLWDWFRVLHADIRDQAHHLL